MNIDFQEHDCLCVEYITQQPSEPFELSLREQLKEWGLIQTRSSQTADRRRLYFYQAAFKSKDGEQ